MNTKTLEDILNKKWVNYKGEKLFINSAEISQSGIINIKTNKRQINMDKYDFDINDFIIEEDVEPKKESFLEKYSERPKVYTPIKPKEEEKIMDIKNNDDKSIEVFENTNSIIKILMNEIESVNTGGNTEKAAVVNDISKTVIEAIKTQVNAVKIMKGVK